MPTVRMKTDSAGPAGNRAAGNVYPVTPAEGMELVQRGYAVWVEPPSHEKPVEVAVMPNPANAALRIEPAKKRR
jgi:hypothetical protein